MELRHLRYFVAVVEEGSVTLAAQRLHTAQPSLSRQIKELEDEVGARLLTRSVRGVVMTPAGRAFLEHARLALGQVDAAASAARRAVEPDKANFRLGFLTGQEMDWLPQAMRVLRDELPSVDVTVSSQDSPALAEALRRGRLDLAFMRIEAGFDELQFRSVVSESLVVILPSDHHLAARATIRPEDLLGEVFIGVADNAPALKRVIEGYLARLDLGIVQTHRVDNLAMAMSLVASTRGVTLLPAYAQNFLPWSVISRPLESDAPSIELVLGYAVNNRSAILGLFLSRIDDLVSRVPGPR